MLRSINVAHSIPHGGTVRTTVSCDLCPGINDSVTEALDQTTHLVLAREGKPCSGKGYRGVPHMNDSVMVMMVDEGFHCLQDMLQHACCVLMIAQSVH